MPKSTAERTGRDTAEVLTLTARIAALTLGDKLRLAAALVDAQKYDLAETIARDIAEELHALQLFPD